MEDFLFAEEDYMVVKEIMTANPETLSEKANLTEAAMKMKRLNVGIIPITRDHTVSGVLTDRDIVVRAIAQKSNPDKTSVRDVMSREVVSCNENEDIRKCVDLMEAKKIRRLIVTDDSGKPVGVVSIGDIATKAQGFGEEIIHSVSEPSKPSR
jgi:CBS domain-containing protein